MNEFDWLDGPVKKRRRIREPKEPEPSIDVPEEPSVQPVSAGGIDKTIANAMIDELPFRGQKFQRPKELIEFERTMLPAKRLYARFLVESLTVAEANKRFSETGYRYTRTTLAAWRNRDIKFCRLVRLLEAVALEQIGITKDKVMLDAEKLKLFAMEPKPILYKGEDTGFEEVNLGAALRALELQGKGVGLTDTQQQKAQVNINIDFSGRQENPGVTIEGEASAA